MRGAVSVWPCAVSREPRRAGGCPAALSPFLALPFPHCRGTQITFLPGARTRSALPGKASLPPAGLWAFSCCVGLGASGPASGRRRDGVLGSPFCCLSLSGTSLRGDPPYWKMAKPCCSGTAWCAPRACALEGATLMKDIFPH